MDKLDIKYIYNVNRGIKDDWGLTAYRIPVFHEDPTRAIKQKRLIEQNSLASKKSLPRIATHRKSVFDLIQNQHKNIPGPGNYDIAKPFIDSKSKASLKKQQPRHSNHEYLESIIKQKLEVPGVGKYDILKDQDLTKSKHMRKRGEHEPRAYDVSSRYDLNLGPGSYNPSSFQTFGREAKNSLIPRAKRTSSLQNLGSKGIPGVGAYHPTPAFSTFQKAPAQKSTRKGASQWPKSERFREPEHTKSSVSAASYKIPVDWGKKKGGNVFKVISSGITRSIYN